MIGGMMNAMAARIAEGRKKLLDDERDQFGRHSNRQLILELRAVNTITRMLMTVRMRMLGTSTDAMSPARKMVCRLLTK